MMSLVSPVRAHALRGSDLSAGIPALRRVGYSAATLSSGERRSLHDMIGTLGTVKVYTRDGDDGTTGLLYGGRVRKDSELPNAYGSVDETQASLGLVRAHVTHGSELDDLLIGLCRDLYVAMAELATAPENRSKLTPDRSCVTAGMVTALEHHIDVISGRFDPPAEFVVPGDNPASAFLDLARTVARRAERASLAAAAEGSFVVPYLNRLSDLLWTLARWQERTTLIAKDV